MTYFLCPFITTNHVMSKNSPDLLSALHQNPEMVIDRNSKTPLLTSGRRVEILASKKEISQRLYIGNSVLQIEIEVALT